MISYSLVPDGTFTSTVSPSSWFRRHFPIGDDGEIRPIVGSASSGVTISKTISSPVSVWRTCTMEPSPTFPLRDLVEVDEGERGHAAVKLADARLQEALALLGRLVLRVLPQVAVLPGLQDLLGELHLQLVVERLDLLLEPLLDLQHLRLRPRNHGYYHGLPRMDAPSEPIRSRTNARYRRFRQLKEFGNADLCLLEGPKLVQEALAAGVSVVEVAVSSRAESLDRLVPTLRSLSDSGVPVLRMDASLLASLSESETSQGLVALARRPEFEEERIFQGIPLVVVAVAFQDPGNLGGLLRTAEAAGASGAYVTEGSVDPLSWKALRGSMGSAFRLPHRRGLTVAEAIARLRERGVAIVGTAASGGTPYVDADWRRPVALLLGNEGAGLSEALLRQADSVVSIPLVGPVESLNVGVAAGLLLFEAARQRR